MSIYNTVLEIAYNEVIKIVTMLKEKHIKLGMQATGNWLSTLQAIKVDANTIEIWGSDYTEYLTKGSKPHFPPIGPIKKWVKYKFGVTDERQATSIAFAVANKINQKGTKWYEQGGSGLIDEVITQDRVNKIQENIGQRVSIEVAENIVRVLEQ